MMWFGTLRVINDDIVKWWMWFWQHPHSDMEIISIPTQWAVEHKDSMGNHKVIEAWEVQVMSAWTGVLHSEMNHNSDIDAKFFQIWIMTRENGIKPSYSQKRFDEKDRLNKFQLLVGPDWWKNHVKINQDAYISRWKLDKDKNITYQKYDSKNGVYIFLISWKIDVWSFSLNDRDAIWIIWEQTVSIKSEISSDVLILEVPMN